MAYKPSQSNDEPGDDESPEDEHHEHHRQAARAPNERHRVHAPLPFPLNAVIRVVCRGLPFVWAGWVVAQFDRWSNSPQLQLLLFFVGTALVYDLTAWATLGFHDTGERKYVLFEGYMTKTSDSLVPLFPEASRIEKKLFKQFGLRPPIVISWETVVPILHYGVISVVLIVLWIKLPLFPSWSRSTRSPSAAARRSTRGSAGVRPVALLVTARGQT